MSVTAIGRWIKTGTPKGFTFICGDCNGRVLFIGSVVRGKPNDICRYPICPWCGKTKSATVKGVIRYEPVLEAEE